jgi:hypothetical protein
METVEALKSKYSGLSEADLISVIAKQSAQVYQLKNLLFSSKSERYKPDPIGMKPLFNEAEELSVLPEPEPDDTDNSKPKKEGARQASTTT